MGSASRIGVDDVLVEAPVGIVTRAMTDSGLPTVSGTTCLTSATNH